MGIGDELKNLTELHQQGSLTNAEFETAKRRVLEREPSQSEPTPSPTQPAHREPTASIPTPQTNGLAIASLILGLFGLGVGHVLALVLGYRAKRQIEEPGSNQRGRGLAIAGIVLGWIGVTLMAILAVVLLSQVEMPPSAAEREAAETLMTDFLSDVADAQREYKSDHGTYAVANELVDGGYVETPSGVAWETRWVETNQFCVKASHEDLERSWKVSSYSWGSSDSPFVPRSLGGC